MSRAPSAKSLVERFKLRERGRQRGLDNMPSANQPTHDEFETAVVDYCNGLYAEQRDEYHNHRPVFEKRMRPPTENLGIAAQIEQSCKDMKDAISAERENLTRLTQESQQAIGELNRFKRDEDRTSDPDFPESRVLHWGFIAALVVLESLINGVFFGTSLGTGLLGGMTYAVVISVVNVAVLGWLAAFTCRLLLHRKPTFRITGLTGLCLIAIGAVILNLLVAHYREALPSDYPPAPEASATVPSPDAEITDNCWRGPNEDDANREALCLFQASPFGLSGFYSYMLLVIGLAMCAFGAVDWFKMDDPYPGYGKRQRVRQKTQERLDEDRDDLLADVSKLHYDARNSLREGFIDPIEYRELALNELSKLQTKHEYLCNFSDDLERSCIGALDVYRTANREARTTPEPSFWQKNWAPNWTRPDAPRQSDVITKADAEARSLDARSSLEEHEQRLRETHDECQALVSELTRIDLHHVTS